MTHATTNAAPAARFWVWRAAGSGDAWKPAPACHIPKAKGGEEFHPTVEAVGPFSTWDIAKEEARERNVVRRLERAAARPPRPIRPAPLPTPAPVRAPAPARETFRVPGLSFEEASRGFQAVARAGVSLDDVAQSVPAAVRNVQAAGVPFAPLPVGPRGFGARLRAAWNRLRSLF